MLKDLPTGSSSVSATPDGTAILRALPVAAALIDERLRYIDSNPEFATLARSCESAARRVVRAEPADRPRGVVADAATHPRLRP